MIDSSRLIKDLEKTGYWNPSDELDDNTRFNLVPNELYSKFDSKSASKLKALIWRFSGHSRQAFVDALESSGIFASHIKKAAPTSDKAKSPRDNIKDRAEILADLFLQGQQDIHDTVLDALVSNDTSTLKADIKDIRSDLLDQGIEWTNENVPALYNVATDNSKAPGHRIAITALSLEMLNKLKEVDSNIGRFTDQTIARLQRMKAKGLLTNEPRWHKEESDVIEEEMDEDNAIPGMKTKDGVLLGLASYVAMLAVTHARDSYNEGVQNKVLESDGDLVQISPELQATSCQDCIEWAGQIVSLTGATEGYPTLQYVTDGSNCFHPNCIHYLIQLE